MNTLPLIIGIVGALGLGAMSPGPSFLFVARTSVVASRNDGVAAAIGMGIGGVMFAIIALMGLHVLLTNVPWLYLALKIAGGSYLVYLGWGIWKGASKPLAAMENSSVAAPRQVSRSFLLGLVTQLSNPKTAIVYASVFTAFLPPHFPISLAVMIAVLVFIVEAGWYTLVALALSSEQPRKWYLHYKVWIDRSAGCVMIFLGGKLVLSTRSV
jgi:RhtB (resistance to homoserine/threonine) family protein